MIDSANELMIALNRAKGGEVLVLAPGTYAGINIRNLHKSPAVTITGKGAVLPGLKIDKSSGLRFWRLEFSAPSPGQFAYLVSSSNDITFESLSVHGALDGAPLGKVSGISILKSENIRVLNSEFQQLRRGIGVGSSSGIVLSGNHFHDLQTDGVIASALVDSQIVDNYFESFFPGKSDHPDAIQFMTAGTTTPSRNILIARNTAFRGKGQAMQGIFMGDETGKLPYENVKIQDNLLVGTGYNGIGLSNMRNVEILRNELLSYEGKTNPNWVLVRRSAGVVARDNKAIKFGFDQVTDLKASNNKTNAVTKDGAAALAARGKSRH